MLKYTNLGEAKEQLQRELDTLLNAKSLVSTTTGEDPTLERTISIYQIRLQHIERFQRMMAKSDTEIRIEEANKRINFDEDPVYRNAVVSMKTDNGNTITIYNKMVIHPFQIFMKERRGITEDEYKAAKELGVYPDPYEEFELSTEGGWLHWALKKVKNIFDIGDLYRGLFNPRQWILSRWRLYPGYG